MKNLKVGKDLTLPLLDDAYGVNALRTSRGVFFSLAFFFEGLVDDG